MKKKVILTILLCAFIFAFIGCATTPFETRLEKISIGMTLEEFQKVFPDAKFGGDTPDGGISYFVYKNIIIVERYYFKFNDNKLSRITHD
ncbi:MAG: hypothetical protein Ta2B_01880 [Termitinemataceae bacterium]|nr:MAG: hypothetical protein Ta2B_01880 [Termitinemataceae bacterium]